MFYFNIRGMNKKVYENIRTIREMKDLTRDYVAAEMQMSTSGYGKIERGEIDLTLSKLCKISTILDVSIIDLIYFDVSNIFKNNIEPVENNKLISKRHTIFSREEIANLERENWSLKNRKL
jgi:transcriptional regulator with XRE-family HTH domain